MFDVRTICIHHEYIQECEGRVNNWKVVGKITSSVKLSRQKQKVDDYYFAYLPRFGKVFRHLVNIARKMLRHTPFQKYVRLVPE